MSEYKINETLKVKMKVKVKTSHKLGKIRINIANEQKIEENNFKLNR